MKIVDIKKCQKIRSIGKYVNVSEIAEYDGCVVIADSGDVMAILLTSVQVETRMLGGRTQNICYFEQLKGSMISDDYTQETYHILQLITHWLTQRILSEAAGVAPLYSIEGIADFKYQYQGEGEMLFTSFSYLDNTMLSYAIHCLNL